MRYHDLIGTISDLVPCAAQGAADATSYIAIWYAPYKCRVTGLGYVSTGAATGNTTNHRNFNVDLDDATEVASLDLITTVNLVVGDNAITITATGGYVDLEAGEVLVLESEKINSGVAIPLGGFRVTYQGN